jgi:hypothetical protein
MPRLHISRKRACSTPLQARRGDEPFVVTLDLVKELTPPEDTRVSNEPDHRDPQTKGSINPTGWWFGPDARPIWWHGCRSSCSFSARSDAEMSKWVLPRVEKPAPTRMETGMDEPRLAERLTEPFLSGDGTPGGTGLAKSTRGTRVRRNSPRGAPPPVTRSDSKH